MAAPETTGHAPPLACSRLLRFPDPASRCPDPPTHHVIWKLDDDGAENGLTCDRHTAEAETAWTFVAIHPYEMTCSMPGAVFVHAQNRCVVDENWLGVAAVEEPAHA